MSTFDQLLSKYAMDNQIDKVNAKREVMQQVTLAGLHRGGFFDKAAFYGGTCLRIFHGLERYSEDMDFSLVQQDEHFHLEDYFDAVVTEFHALGSEVIISKKEKGSLTNIESAFLKTNTSVYNVSFSTEKHIKIKIEVDVNPPQSFSTESKLLLQPYSFMVRCFTLPSLFAGKMHAFVFRPWQTRVKGRDWYDFEWYVRNQIPLDFEHLRVRVLQGHNVKGNFTRELFFEMLKDKIRQTNIDKVKEDVRSFLRHPKEMDIWSTAYFLQLADMMKILQEPTD